MPSTKASTQQAREERAAAALDDDDDIPLEVQIERARKLLEEESKPKKKKKEAQVDSPTRKVRRDKWGQIIDEEVRTTALNFGNPYTKETGGVTFKETLEKYQGEKDKVDEDEPEAYKQLREAREQKTQIREEAKLQEFRKSKLHRFEKALKKKVKRFKKDIEVSDSDEEEKVKKRDDDESEDEEPAVLKQSAGAVSKGKAKLLELKGRYLPSKERVMPKFAFDGSMVKDNKTAKELPSWSKQGDEEAQRHIQEAYWRHEEQLERRDEAKMEKYQRLLSKGLINKEEYNRIALKMAIIKQERRYHRESKSIDNYENRKATKTVLRMLKDKYKTQYGHLKASKQEQVLAKVEQKAKKDAEAEIVDEHGRVRRPKTVAVRTEGESLEPKIARDDDEKPPFLQRAWSTILWLWAQTKHIDISQYLIRKTAKKGAVHTTLANTASAFFRHMMITLLICSIVFYDTPGEQEYYMLNRAQSFFSGNYLSLPKGYTKFDEVNSIDMLWLFIRTTLVNCAFGEIQFIPGPQGERNEYVPLDPFYKPMRVHVLMGGIRLRQLRVNSMPCPEFVPPLSKGQRCVAKTGVSCRPAVRDLEGIPCPESLGTSSCVRDFVSYECECQFGSCYEDDMDQPAQGKGQCVPQARTRHEGRLCYPEFSSATASVEPFGRDDTYKWTKGGSFGQSLANPGKVSVYSSDGYVVDLTPNRTLTEELIRKMTAEGCNPDLDTQGCPTFLDTATRALSIEFSLYNANRQIFLIAKYLFEFPPSGGIVKSQSWRAYRIFRYLTVTDYMMGCVELLFLFVTFSIAQEQLGQVQEIGAKAYFNNVWAVVDLLSLFVQMIVIIMRVMLINAMRGTVVDPSDFIDLQRISYVTFFENVLLAFTILLAWIRWYKFVRYIPGADLFIETIENSSVFIFSMLFFTLLAAFVTCFNLAFGGDTWGYRSNPQTTLTLLQLLLGQYDFDELVRSNRVMGPLLFFLLVVLVKWFLVFMYTSMLNDSYVPSC